MAAKKVQTALRLPSGVEKDFIRNLLLQDLQQQQQQENDMSFTNSSYVRNVIWKCAWWLYTISKAAIEICSKK